MVGKPECWFFSPPRVRWSLVFGHNQFESQFTRKFHMFRKYRHFCVASIFHLVLSKEESRFFPSEWEHSKFAEKKIIEKSHFSFEKSRAPYIIQYMCNFHPHNTNYQGKSKSFDQYTNISTLESLKLRQRQ